MIEYYFDGSGTGYGFAVAENKEIAFFKSEKSQEDVTVNENEYNGLILILEYLVKNKLLVEHKDIVIQGDSMLVINQVNGIWRAKNEKMKQKRNKVLGLITDLKCKDANSVTIKWIPGKQNLADRPSRL